MRFSMRTGYPMTLRTVCLICLCAMLALNGCGKKGPKTITADQDASQLYQRASKAMNAAQFDIAIQSFQLLEARYPFSPYALQAQIDLAYSYYRFGRPEQATAEADRFIRFNPTHPNVDYAYYIKGLANFERNKTLLDKWFPRNPADFDQKKLRDSFSDFSQLINKFPNSRYAPDARQRMIFLRNKMAEHEIRVAEFYMERKAWVAASNRANNILKSFANTPSNKPALIILVKAYRELGLNDSADQALRTLKLNFPDQKDI